MQPSEKQNFLIEAAIMLHRYGTPSHRLERIMRKVASSIDVRGEFLYTPTALVISLEEAVGSCTVVRRVDSGAVDVDKLIQFDELLGRVESSKISVNDAVEQLREIGRQPSLYSFPVYAAACALACSCVAVFFGGGVAEIVVAGLIGALVACIEWLHARFQGESGLLQPVAGTVAAILSLLIAHFVLPIDDRLTTLASLIVLIPGLQLTVALTEVAVGHLSAGVARLAGAMVSLATLFVGVAITWRIADTFRRIPDAPAPVPDWWQWIALLVAPIAFAIVFRAGIRQWPVIMVVSITGVVISWLFTPRLGLEVGSFLGSLAVGCGSNLYARLRDRPALIALTPGMLILVPGSLGYRALSALMDQQTTEGVQFAFAMMLVGLCLVGGLLVSNVIVPPRRIL